MEYQYIIIDKNGDTYRALYQHKPIKKAPSIDKIYSLGFIMRLIDGYTIQDYYTLPEWNQSKSRRQ